MSMLWVGPTVDNLVAVKDPSEMSWGLSDISASDSGRVEDENDTMYKNRTSQKRKLSLGWSNPTWEEASVLVNAFDPEYIFVKYPDLKTGTYITKEFYRGDISAPYKMWTVATKKFSKVSFDIIER